MQWPYTLNQASQARYLARAQAYLAAHGAAASLEATDVYASRPE